MKYTIYIIYVSCPNIYLTALSSIKSQVPSGRDGGVLDTTVWPAGGTGLAQRGLWHGWLIINTKQASALSSSVRHFYWLALSPCSPAVSFWVLLLYFCQRRGGRHRYASSILHLPQLLASPSCCCSFYQANEIENFYDANTRRVGQPDGPIECWKLKLLYKVG